MSVNVTQPNHCVLYRSSVHVIFRDEDTDLVCLVGDAIQLIQEYVLNHREVYFQYGVLTITFVPALIAEKPLPDDDDECLDELANDDLLCGETDIISIGRSRADIIREFMHWRETNDEWRASIANLPDVWWPIPGALFNSVVLDDTELTNWYLSDESIEAIAAEPTSYRLVEVPLLTIAANSKHLPRKGELIGPIPTSVR